MRIAWARVGTWVIALLVGGVYGIAGTIAHAYTVGWFPLGLVLAVVGAGALLVAVRALTADRWTALAAGIGLVLTALLFSGRGPGGSVVVPGGELDTLGGVSLGQVWMVVVPILVALAVVWPDRRGIRAADGD